MPERAKPAAMCTVSRFSFRGRQNVRARRADVRTKRPGLPPRRPPGRISAGSRGKSCRTTFSTHLRRCVSLGSPSRGAGSAKPRLRGCRRFAGKNPNRKFSLRFGKEEMSTEEKRRRLRRLVPSWSFLTRLRRPYLFRLAGKDRGEKGRLVTFGCFLRLNLGWNLAFRHRSTR